MTWVLPGYDLKCSCTRWHDIPGFAYKSKTIHTDPREVQPISCIDFRRFSVGRHAFEDLKKALTVRGKQKLSISTYFVDFRHTNTHGNDWEIWSFDFDAYRCQNSKLSNRNNEGAIRRHQKAMVSALPILDIRFTTKSRANRIIF